MGGAITVSGRGQMGRGCGRGLEGSRGSGEWSGWGGGDMAGSVTGRPWGSHGGCSRGSGMVTGRVLGGLWESRRGRRNPGSHRGFSWQSLRGPQEDSGGLREGMGSQGNQGYSLRGPWESPVPFAGAHGVSGEPGGHRMVPRGLGDSRKGDKEAWGAHREGKGPSGWDLCSPFLCALGVPTEIPAGPFWGFLVVFPLLKQGFFAVRMLGAGRGSGG